MLGLELRPRPSKCPAGAGLLTAFNKGRKGSGSPCAETLRGAFQPPKRCLLTWPPRQDKQGKKLVVDAAGCFVTCRVVSPELVWPWQLVPLTFRMDNLKQAPAGPPPRLFNSLQASKDKSPFLHLSLASAGAGALSWKAVEVGWGGWGAGLASGMGRPRGTTSNPSVPSPSGLGVYASLRLPARPAPQTNPI